VSRRLISSGSTFEADIGYSRAVVQGPWVFVSGTTGFDYAKMTIPDGLKEQTEQCMNNIAAALEQAGSSLRDVVRVRYVLPDGDEFPQCWPILRKYFGEARPAAMMIAARLADPRMKIEIEVTALKGGSMNADRTTPLGWQPAEWIAYYGQCREFQSTVALKFINLITQSSVFTTAVCAGMITLRTSINSRLGFFAIAAAAILPLLVFWRFLVAYYLQVRAAGGVLKEIEDRLEIPDGMALLRTLRQKPYAFYGTKWVAVLAWSYPVLLATLLITTAVVLGVRQR